MLLTILALACGAPPTGGAADDTGAPGGGDGGGDGGAADGGYTGTPTEEGSIPAWRAQAEVTWTLTFDAAAQAEGYADCSYRRTWEGVQVLDLDYLCPECALHLVGDATLQEGLDCAATIVSDPPTVREEGWGWSEDGRFFRGSYGLSPMGELGTIDAGRSEGAALSWESEGEVGTTGTMLLQAAGTVSWWLDEQTLLPDPWPARTEPYTCGWPTDDPGTLVRDYDLALGTVLPNVRLRDQCDEKLALWDLYGRWLVVDSAQPDCGPCRTMASTAEDFVQSMAAEGIEVVVVSLLGKGLAEPFSEPDEAVFDDWVATYQPSGPVLRDRGYGYALLPDLALSATGEEFGYPTWMVIAPDMTIAHVNVGFSDWDAVAEVIRGAR
ncbi:redoxin domain-containing protein [Myxococcota bacterium]|nr:redoxin domain-containing protein [Myxococcota bacterium]